MKKLLFLLCVMSSVVTFAQRNMEVKNVTPENGVYSGEENEAGVVISCPASMTPLTFDSSMDQLVNVVKAESVNGKSVYTIAFPCGNKYRGRVLSIASAGFNTGMITLELTPKQLMAFDLSDPDATVGVGCYRENRNKANEAFNKGKYTEALDLYKLSQECSDADTAEAHRYIAITDSIIGLRAKADQAYDALKYYDAQQLYASCLSLNPFDEFANNRQGDCVDKQTAMCGTFFQNAETYYNNHDYERAKILYQKVIDEKCVNTSAAVTRLTEIENMQTSKKNHAHVLTYEISQNQPIGLSTGSYKLKRVGGYFTFRLNTEVFDAARNNPKFYIPANIASLKANSSEDDIDDDANFSPEVNISFGWTVPLFHTIMGGQTFALHTFFGPGFTAMVQYKWKSETLMEYKKEPSYEAMSEKELTAKNDVFETDNYSRSMKMSVSPEIGICVRWSFVALRYTFQYRFAVKKEYEDFLGKTRSVFGVGVAF